MLSNYFFDFKCFNKIDLKLTCFILPVVNIILTLKHRQKDGSRPA